jgi:Tfp pilus assembly protein PilX
MISGNRKNSESSERGFALFLALLVLLLVTAVGTGMVVMSNTETSISSNFSDEQVAFYAARGGLEEARDRLRVTAPNSLTASLPTNLPGQTGGVLYVTNPANGETDTPWLTNGSNYPDDEICQEVTCTGGIPGGSPWYATASASTSYAAIPVLSWKWARITVKTNKMSSGVASTNTVDGNSADSYRVCWNGTNEVTTSATSCAAIGDKEVYMLTALAVTSTGSRRMIQSEATSTAFPTLPGPMIFDGSNPAYSAPNSNAFSVNGNDAAKGPNAGAGCGPAVNEPAVGGYDNGSVTTLVGDIPKPAKYTGTGGTPSVSNVNSQLGALNTVSGLRALVSSVQSAASSANIYTGNASSLTNPGTNAAPVINVVQGNLSLGGGFSGAGILLVEGTLTMSGNPSYNGIILVIGQGVLVKNGGGNGTTNGSILVANLFDSKGNPIASGAPGVPSITWNGGGNATIQYDSCWISAVTQSFPFQFVAEREMMY